MSEKKEKPLIPCGNKGCYYKKHLNPVDCEYRVTGACRECSKHMWERDKAYSIYVFGDVYCGEHIPEKTKLGKVYAIRPKGQAQLELGR